jgi:uncharacterized membrane protein YphA (DoxX/SURF4 family)
MKYAIWFVRLIFAAWMIPAGLNHFVPLFPQPMGNQPLSTELITALLDSQMFAMTKAVELLAGIAVLTGLYAPLMVIVCMPVSFCVWYWDVPLQGWSSGSAIYGWAVLVCNLLLCLAYIDSYRAMLAPRAAARDGGSLVLVARVVFGTWMLASGANMLFGPFYPVPAGHEPLAVQLMAALTHSKLLYVAAGIQLGAGALILAGIFVPLALCVMMPVTVCAAFWAVILEHAPLGIGLALAAVALNAWLMLGHLGSYRDMLRRRALTVGEKQEPGSNFDTVYAIPFGRVSQSQFALALVPLLAAAAFYYLWVFGDTGRYALLILAYPAVVLVARLLQGLGRGPAAPEPA